LMCIFGDPSPSLGKSVRNSGTGCQGKAQHWHFRAPGHARDMLEVRARAVSFEQEGARGTFTHMTDPVSAGAWGFRRGVAWLATALGAAPCSYSVASCEVHPTMPCVCLGLLAAIVSIDGSELHKRTKVNVRSS